MLLSLVMGFSVLLLHSTILQSTKATVNKNNWTPPLTPESIPTPISNSSETYWVYAKKSLPNSLETTEVKVKDSYLFIQRSAKAESDHFWSFFSNDCVTVLCKRKDFLKILFIFKLLVFSVLQECLGTGPGCLGQWWSPHPWRGSRNV